MMHFLLYFLNAKLLKSYKNTKNQKTTWNRLTIARCSNSIVYILDDTTIELVSLWLVILDVLHIDDFLFSAAPVSPHFFFTTIGVNWPKSSDLKKNEKMIPDNRPPSFGIDMCDMLLTFAMCWLVFSVMHFFLYFLIRKLLKSYEKTSNLKKPTKTVCP